MEERNEIRNVAIIGNGMLGTQIAMAAIYHGYNVFLFDPISRIRESYRRYLSISGKKSETAAKFPIALKRR